MSRHRLIRGNKPDRQFASENEAVDSGGSWFCSMRTISFSALRRLKTWNRTTMTEDRLNGLALLYIHKNVNIDRERVLDAFDASGNRRIGSLQF